MRRRDFLVSSFGISAGLRSGTTVWPEWNNLIGAQMKGEFHANFRVIVEDPKFPSAMAWGKTSFMFEEQHAMFGATYSRDIDHVILRLDPTTVPDKYRQQHPDGVLLPLHGSTAKAASSILAGENSKRLGTIRACRSPCLTPSDGLSARYRRISHRIPYRGLVSADSADTKLEWHAVKLSQSYVSSCKASFHNCSHKAAADCGCASFADCPAHNCIRSASPAFNAASRITLVSPRCTG